ncbi:MAG: TIGR04190 family B12-binding domain/radical SAM domain protein [Deltaproteobacteria bacterium]
MKQVDLVLLHPPSVYRFRELPIFHGPISDVIPSSSIFENYPIGFLTMSEYLSRHDITVRIVNLAMKMLRDFSFDADSFLSKLHPAAFGIDLHWLPHVDGALSLAEAIKRLHPDIPVIFGGLSATYYRKEIMRDYPCVDFLLCGDSTEEPLRLLMEAIISRGDYGIVPNLVWRDEDGKVTENGISYRPTNLDYVHFDYSHPIKMTMKYHDPSGYLPFRNWLSNPVMAVFSCRGCFHDCVSCGGSASAFRGICKRERPAFRSPELLAKDIRNIARVTGAPVMVIGDLLQAGKEYAERFLRAVKKYRIRNELAIEFFHPPPADFVRRVADSVVNFNVEISPESHDPLVRKAFGKTFDNDELEASIEAFVRSTCRRLDLFFMVGLPHQDYRSVMETVEYCGELLRRYGGTKKLLPMFAPLAPFVDPGSRLFEEAESFGYRLFYRTLGEHRQAMLMPTWKHRLNYETEWMTRDEIVRATYDGALKLTELKAAHGVLDKGKAEEIKQHIRMAKELFKRMENAPAIDASLEKEIFRLNQLDSLCGKHELEWPVKGWKLHLMNFFRLLVR